MRSKKNSLLKNCESKMVDIKKNRNLVNQDCKLWNKSSKDSISSWLGMAKENIWETDSEWNTERQKKLI